MYSLIVESILVDVIEATVDVLSCQSIDSVVWSLDSALDNHRYLRVVLPIVVPS